MLANIVESSDDAIITTSLDGIIISWNKGAEQIYGYSAKEVLGKPMSILEPSTLVEEAKELIELIKQEDRIHHYETSQLRKDGKIINVSLTLSPIFDASENLIAILVIARDITKSKKAEEKLQKSEERYRIVTEQTGQVIYDYDLRTDKCTWSGAIEEVTGYSFEEFKKFGKDVWIKNIHLRDMNYMDKKFQDVRKTGDKFKEELRLRRKDGTCIYIENNGVCLTNNEGQPYRAIGILKDITKMKEAEAKLKETLDNLEKLVEKRTAELEKAYTSLKESEKSLAEAQKMAHLGNWDWNIVTNEFYGSGEMYRIFGLNPQESGATYDVFLSFVHPEDREYVDNAAKEALKGKTYAIDYKIVRPDGEERIVHSQGEVIFDEKNTPIGMKGTVQDITGRKRAEDAFEKIEIARKKEIHHRIKNNLQVISSLLDLQADKFRDRGCVEDSEVLSAFRESQDRVMSIALIHEELHEGKGTDTLNFSQYLERLVNNLFQTYRLGNANASLNIELEENLSFDMDIAIPLGMIVNELVSNSLKHAFIGRDKGEIRIKLCREKTGEYTNSIEESKSEGCKSSILTLTVSDNGVGIPENLVIEDLNSLGMQLVTSLVDQLDGELELKRNNGTEFAMRFTVTKNKQTSAPAP